MKPIIESTSTPAGCESARREWSTLRIDRHHELFAPLQKDLLGVDCVVVDADFGFSADPPPFGGAASLPAEETCAPQQRNPMAWSFVPYPQCSVTSIHAIHFWWLSVDAAREPIRHLDDVVGVVGVVLSPFGCRSGEMEAYIQVVLVRPAARRQGVGNTMVKRVLNDLADQQISAARGDSSGPPKLTRVRLHTMVDSTNTRKYLNDTLTQPATDNDDSRDQTDFGALFSMMSSVRSMYEDFGFSVRRNCPKYYASMADGIEMVLDRDRLLQRFGGSSTDEPRKRNRDIE
jgi:ribosomal protein S18 acetylase RimI-like enzyme